jgi:hypothetical protein
MSRLVPHSPTGAFVYRRSITEGETAFTSQTHTHTHTIPLFYTHTEEGNIGLALCWSAEMSENVRSYFQTVPP